MRPVKVAFFVAFPLLEGQIVRAIRHKIVRRNKLLRLWSRLRSRL